MSERREIEQRLQDAMRDRAQSVEPAGGFGAIEQAVRRHRSRQRLLAAVTAIVVVVGGAAGALALTDGGDSDPDQVVTDPAITVAPTTTTPPTTRPDDGVETGEDTHHATAEAAATAFATTALGYADPVLLDGLVVQPRPTSSIRTQIYVVEQEAGFRVTGASTNQSGFIEEASIGDDTVAVTGRARAFEATLTVATLDVEGNLLDQDFAMVGSGEELEKFSVGVDLSPGAHFVLIGEADASGDGRFSWAAVATLPAPPMMSAAVEPRSLHGVGFGTPVDEVIESVPRLTGGSVTSDTTQRAADVGAVGFACHGLDGDGVQELRRVVVEAPGVVLHLYIADGVYLGYVVEGDDPEYTTRQGVGLGSTEEELIAAYGNQVSIDTGISEPQRWASLAIPGADLPMVFEYDAGEPVERIVVGGRCAD